MINLGSASCVLAFIYSQLAHAEFSANVKIKFSAEFTSRTVPILSPIYVPRTAPINSYLDSVDLGTYTPWVWWNATGMTEVGIYLPVIVGADTRMLGGAYVKEINRSGIGFILYGSVNSPCSGGAYVDGVNTKDDNLSNRILCGTMSRSNYYSVTLRAAFYKIRDRVQTQILPSTRAAMLVLYNNGFITSDSNGNLEPNIWMGPINVVSGGCEIINKTITVPFGKVDKSTFFGVGSTSANSQRHFQINLDCDPISPIKITFIGTADLNKTPGTIALNDHNGSHTAKGYGIQIKYNNQPIKLNQQMTILESNNTGQYSIPLEASYIQTSSIMKSGKANGTLQFNMQYH